MEGGIQAQIIIKRLENNGLPIRYSPYSLTMLLDTLKKLKTDFQVKHNPVWPEHRPLLRVEKVRLYPWAPAPLPESFIQFVVG